MKRPREISMMTSFPVFSQYWVRIVLTEDVEQSRIVRDNVLGPYPGGNAAGMHCSTPGQSWLIFRFGFNEGTLVHECWHCIYRLMDYNGARIENEVVAYHLGFLVQKVANFAKSKRVQKFTKGRS